MSQSERTKVPFGERVRAHLAIARLDHSIKNLFVLPGVIVPLSVDPSLFNLHLIRTLILAFVAITLVACSNYVINEVLDAPPSTASTPSRKIVPPRVASSASPLPTSSGFS